MTYDIHNQKRKVKGRFTHSFTHPCGAGFVMKHERDLVHVAIGVHDWGNEIWWKDVKDHVGDWEKYGWPTLEESGQISRFWRKP